LNMPYVIGVGEIQAMTMEEQPTKTLDARGLVCPEPVFRTKVAVDSLKVGECLQVLADDPAAEQDIPSWARRTGQEILSFRRDGRILTFMIRRTK